MFRTEKFVRQDQNMTSLSQQTRKKMATYFYYVAATATFCIASLIKMSLRYVLFLASSYIGKCCHLADNCRTYYCTIVRKDSTTQKKCSLFLTKLFKSKMHLRSIFTSKILLKATQNNTFFTNFGCGMILFLTGTIQEALI